MSYVHGTKVNRWLQNSDSKYEMASTRHNSVILKSVHALLIVL